MDIEGSPRHLSDLKPIRTRKINASYTKSNHKIVLIGREKKVWKIVIFTFACILLIAFFRSDLYKQLSLINSLRNKKILVGFQNSAELRPTGGFWGSFAILEANNFLGCNLRFDTNPYKKDNLVFKKSTVPLPKPMQETWPDRNQSFVNANYDISFPDTAKSLQWFLSEGWNEKTDGVIGLSSLAVIDLLELTGPLHVDGIEINSQNFTKILSDKIDKDYWLEENNKLINEPKTILKEMAPVLINKTKKINKITLFRFAKKEIKEGRLVVFFNDNKSQSLAESLGISGEIEHASIDYLNINNTNLNGGKSSLNANQKIRYSLSDGLQKPIGTLTIERILSGAWPGILNRNYTRALVPLGSRLLSARLDEEIITENVEISEESGKTSFGFWFSVSPLEKRVAELEYELPFENQSLSNYNLIWQKQPGTLEDSIEILLNGKLKYSGPFNENFKKFSF